jgi:hypothetical protein
VDMTVGKFVLTLSSLSGDVGATEVLVLFVLNTEEFVLRNEGEVFQHFVSFCHHLRSLRHRRTPKLGSQHRSHKSFSFFHLQSLPLFLHPPDLHPTV